MRLATLSRRSLAVVAATGLLTTGGFVAAAPAWAAPVITSTNTDRANNTTTQDLVINGSGFNTPGAPNGPSVTLHPLFTGTDVGDIDAPVKTPSSQAELTGTQVRATANLTLAAPGPYELQVSQQTSMGQTQTAKVNFTVTSLGNAEALDVDPGKGSGRDAIPLDITGRNIAKGAVVKFLDPTTCAVDPKIQFIPGDPNTADYLDPGTNQIPLNSGAYVSLQELHGSYKTSDGFTPGLHKVRIINTNETPFDDCNAGTTTFFQPFFTDVNVAPRTRGAGSTNQVVTVVAAGMRAGTKLSIADLDTATNPPGGAPGSTPCTDITVGASTLSSDGGSVSAPVTLIDSCGNTVSTGGRTVTLSSDVDGARYKVDAAFNATAPPVVTRLTPSSIGQGAKDVTVTVTGTGFSTQGGAPIFDLGGGGVTAVLKDGVGITSTQAVLVVNVAQKPDSVVSGRSVTVSNADKGTSTTGPSGNPSTFPFNIVAGPSITSVSPASLPRGASNVTVSLTGTGFDTNGVSIDFLRGGQPVAGLSRTTGTASSATSATTRVTLDGTVAFGPVDVVITNLASKGSFTCAACFGVDSLSVSPAAAANTNSSVPVAFTGPGITGGNATLYRSGTPVAGGITRPVTASNGQGTATYDLTSAAPGKYNVLLTLPDATTLSCTACFGVTGQVPAFSSSTTAGSLPLEPASGGQGARNRAVTVNGSNFDKGTTLTFPNTSGITVHDVTFVSPTKFTALLDIAPGAATGDVNGTLTETDGTTSTTTSPYTITDAPLATAISPAALGQGASGQVLTITGDGFVGATSATVPYNPATMTTLDLGSGVTVTDPSKITVTQGSTNPIAPTSDTITVPVSIGSGAAVGTRLLTLANPDGGVGTLADKFTVNAGPKIDAITPNTARVGATGLTIVVTGSGFAPDATITIAGFTQTAAPTVAGDGKTLTVQGAVDPAAARGARAVTILNPTDKGTGSCSACFTIGDVPGAPAITSVTAGDRSFTVTWNAPADDGGSGIGNYTITADGGSPVYVTGDKRSATVTGLTPAKSYAVAVTATNAIGTSPAASGNATPYGVPLAPTTVTATAGPGSVKVDWSGADAQGESIDNYTVRASDGATTVEREVSGSVSTLSFGGLTPGKPITFTVKAKNAAGYGAYSTKSATATPTATGTTKLTSTRSPATSVAGTAVTYSGRLTNPSGAAIAGARITVNLRPDIGGARNIVATTASNGAWSFRFAPVYNTTVRATYAGDASNGAATAPAYKQLVQVRITKSAPATGSARTTFTVKGATSPNKARRTIGLYQGSKMVGKGIVAANGTYVINVKLARGTYTLRVALGATPGNAAGATPNFVIKRT